MSEMRLRELSKYGVLGEEKICEECPRQILKG